MDVLYKFLLDEYIYTHNFHCYVCHDHPMPLNYFSSFHLSDIPGMHMQSSTSELSTWNPNIHQSKYVQNLSFFLIPAKARIVNTIPSLSPPPPLSFHRSLFAPPPPGRTQRKGCGKTQGGGSLQQREGVTRNQPPAGTFTSDLQPPDLGGNKCLLQKARRLQCFVVTA